METSMKKDRAIKGSGRFLQLVADIYHERYQGYWNQKDPHITSVLTFYVLFDYPDMMVENMAIREGLPGNRGETLRLIITDVVLGESDEEIAGNIGGFLKKAGDEMNAEYLVRSYTGSSTNTLAFHFILHCMTTYVHLVECV